MSSSSTPIGVRLSGGAGGVSFVWGEEQRKITQQQLTDALSRVPNVTVYKQCKADCDFIIFADAAEGPSDSAVRASGDAEPVRLTDFVNTVLNQAQRTQLNEELQQLVQSKAMMKQSDTKKKRQSSRKPPKKASGRKPRAASVEEMKETKGRVVHFEIQADDIERAVEFYRKVFGWQIKPWQGAPESDPYWLINTGPQSEVGINGGILRRRGARPKPQASVNAFVCTIGVQSIAEMEQAIPKAGGIQVTPREEIPGMGLLSYFHDTEGNTFGVMQPSMNMPQQ